MEGAGSNPGGPRNTGTARSKGAPAKTSASMDGSLKRLAVEAAGEQKFLKSPTSNERALSAKEANKAVQEMQNGGLLVGDPPMVPKGEGPAAIRALAGPGLSSVLPRTDVVAASYNHPVKDSPAGASPAESDTASATKATANPPVNESAVAGPARVTAADNSGDDFRDVPARSPMERQADQDATAVRHDQHLEPAAGGDGGKDTTQDNQPAAPQPGTPPEQVTGQAPGVSTSDRNAFVKDQVQAQQDQFKALLGDKHADMMRELFGDAANPKDFNVDAEIKRLEADSKNPQKAEERRLLQQLKELKSIAQMKEGEQELDALQQSANKTTDEYKKAVEAAQAKIKQGQEINKNRDAREQILKDPVFAEYLRKNGIDPMAVDVAAEKDSISAKPKDSLKESDVRIHNRFEEAQQIALSHEGQQELDALKQSGENLLEGEGKKKADAALAKIEDGAAAQRVQFIREQIAQDANLQKLLKSHNVDLQMTDTQHLDKILADLNSIKENSKGGLDGDDKKLWQKLHELNGKTADVIVGQELANIDEKDPRAPELRKAALLKMAHAHGEDKGFLGKFQEGIREKLTPYSSAQLKQQRTEWWGLRRTLKKLQKDLKAAETDAEKDRLNKSISATKELRNKLLKDFAAHWTVKWLVLLAIFGPAALALLTALAASKGLQLLGKAGGGQ